MLVSYGKRIHIIKILTHTLISIGGADEAVELVRSVKNVSKLSKAVSPNCFRMSSGSAASEPSASSVSPPT